MATMSAKLNYQHLEMQTKNGCWMHSPALFSLLPWPEVLLLAGSVIAFLLLLFILLCSQCFLLCVLSNAVLVKRQLIQNGEKEQ